MGADDMTEGEQRAYQRGYNRGRARMGRLTEIVVRIAKGYRDRLVSKNRPRCETCLRWTRGSPGRCVWGICAANFDRTFEPAMWVEAMIGDRDVKRQLITTEDFGCTNWIPK